MEWLWPVMLLPVALGLLPWRAPNSTHLPFYWPAEVGLAVACGLVTGLLSAFWLAEFHLTSGNYLSSDFHEYCASMVHLAADDLENYSQARSTLAGATKSWLHTRIGVVDALNVAGILSQVVIGTGLYLWGRAAHGRIAGVFAAVAACTMAPLLLQSRTISFYPEVTAAFTLAAGFVALALRFRSLRMVALGAAAVGLTLLVDLRGVFWAVPYLGLVGLAAAWSPTRRWPLRFGCLLLILWAAWFAGRYAYTPWTNPLETHIGLRYRLIDRGIEVPEPLLENPTSAYVWGRTPVHEIPATFLTVWQRSGHLPDEIWDNPKTRSNTKRHVTPWRPVWIGSGILALLGLARGRDRKARLLILIGTGVPFLVALKGAIEVQQAFPRFVANSLPWFAVLMGVAGAVLVDGWHSRSGRQGWARLAAATALAFLLVLGAIPTWLSPTASWRTPTSASPHAIRRVVEAAEEGTAGRPGYGDCVGAVKRDLEAGRSTSGSLYGGIWSD